MRFQLSGLLCALVLAFAVGCGKDNKSGSKGYQYPNLFNSGLTLGNQQVLEKNLNWYKGNVEGTPTMGQVRVTKTKYTNDSTPDCEQKKFLGLPFQYCKYSNSTESEKIFDEFVNFVPSTATINTKNNVELNAIFSGVSGTLMNATDVSFTASQLEFLRGDGVIVTYIIDRSKHSTLNPIRKIETSRFSRVEIITSTGF